MVAARAKARSRVRCVAVLWRVREAHALERVDQATCGRVLGGGEFDLTASLPARTRTSPQSPCVGWIDIVVDEGTQVTMTGFSLLGGREVNVAAGAGPAIHRAIAVLGAVKVTTPADPAGPRRFSSNRLRLLPNSSSGDGAGADANDEVASLGRPSVQVQGVDTFSRRSVTDLFAVANHDDTPARSRRVVRLIDFERHEHLHERSGELGPGVGWPRPRRGRRRVVAPSAVRRCPAAR